MTDRAIVYNTAIPQTKDLLKTSKFAMLGDAFLALATLGNDGSNPSTVVSGLACTPTNPASLQVNVGPGSIFALDTTDVAAYGDLGTDFTQIFKMGIRPETGTLTINPPTTVGFSQVYLVQAILSNVDSGSTVLSYYNSSNPALPYSGPSNSGTSQFTERTNVCTIALKAGVAASTGSQVTPSPDAGYIALYAITVANGQTQINNTHITTINSGYAPFVNTALPYIPSVSQSGKWIYAVDKSIVLNTVTVELSPAPTALIAGFSINVKMANGVTGPATISVNGFPSKAITKSLGSALNGGEWAAGDIINLRYDGTTFQGAGISAPLSLGSNKNLYINNIIGNDTLYDGTTGTVSGVHGPFKTLAKALSVMTTYNLGGYNFNIYVADGTYTTSAIVTLPTPNGSGDVNIIGNVADPQLVKFVNSGTGTVLSSGGGRYNISGVWIQATTATASDSAHGIWATGTSVIWLDNVSFSGCPGAHINAGPGGFIGVTAAIRLYGGGGYHMAAGSNGIIAFPGGVQAPQLTIVNPISFSGTFAFSATGAAVAASYGGIGYNAGASVTGKRYLASLNGTISTGGAGESYLPGTIAGTKDNGGQYL